MTIVSERLKLARVRKKLKQTQVMEETGVNNKTLSGYENGISEPDLETLRTLADFYGVSVDWLAGKSDEPVRAFPDAGAEPVNIAYFGGTREDLTEEEAKHLRDSLEMFRLLKAKRNSEGQAGETGKGN